jgi:hypothetical protein
LHVPDAKVRAPQDFLRGFFVPELVSAHAVVFAVSKAQGPAHLAGFLFFWHQPGGPDWRGRNCPQLFFPTNPAWFTPQFDMEKIYEK